MIQLKAFKKASLILMCSAIMILATSMRLSEYIPIKMIKIQEKEIEINPILGYCEMIVLSGCIPVIEHVEIIYEKSIEKNVDFMLVLALVSEESRFSPTAYNINKNKSNDFGLFQLNNEWHCQYRDDIVAHIDHGVDFLGWCLLVEKEDETRALSRYNSGKPNTKAGISYANRVLKKKKEFSESYEQITTARL